MALGRLGEGELWGAHRFLVIYSSSDDSDLVVQEASSLRGPSKDDMIHVYGITFYTNSFCWWVERGETPHRTWGMIVVECSVCSFSCP